MIRAKTKHFSSAPRHLLYTRKHVNLTGVLTEDFLSSSAMSLLLLVPRRRPDRLTGRSVFQRHGNRGRRGGREKVRLSVDAALEGSGRGKLQRTEREKQRTGQMNKTEKVVRNKKMTNTIIYHLHLFSRTHSI